MDQRTIGNYMEQPHKGVVDQAALLALVTHYTPECGSILEVGCGSGKLSAKLSGLGYQVTATDAVAPESLPASTRFLQAAFPVQAIHPLLDPAFRVQTLVCAAMLMHVPDRELLQVLRQFQDLLHTSGHLLVSFCHGGRTLDDESRDERGILYVERTTAEVSLLLERIGFQIVERRLDQVDQQGRLGIRWDVLVAVNLGKGTSRGVDHASSLISKDSKTTTYKLALLRALTDMALDRPQFARWTPAGNVRIPLGPITDLWIKYYKPLLAAGIPQIGKGQQLAFATTLMDLSVSSADLARKVQEAIIKGPVQYSKGADEHSLFRTYEGASGKREGIEIPGELWRELTLIGHWIRDSLLLEWARVSAGFAKDKVDQLNDRMAEFLPVILATEGIPRDTLAARRVFTKQESICCVWTGKSLSSDGMAIDHVVPFSQWRTNAWWNLMPSDAKVNNQKSDRLPSLRLLGESRTRMGAHWDCCYREYPEEFTMEIQRDLLGSGPLHDHWQAHLFEALCDRIHLLRTQRGLDTWEPR